MILKLNVYECLSLKNAMPAIGRKYCRHRRRTSYSKIIHKITSEMAGGCIVNDISKAVFI